MSKSSTTEDLDRRLRQILARPEFLEMRGVAKEVPVFIQTYDPADEDRLRLVVKGVDRYLRQQGLRVKQVDLFELVLKLLEERRYEERSYLEAVLEQEASWSKGDLFDTLQNVADPNEALVPRLMAELGDDCQISLITGSGRVYPFLRTHTILEALQSAMMPHPVVIFFPGEYSQDADGGSYLRLFGTSATTRIENPHYRATNLDYYDIPSS